MGNDVHRSVSLRASHRPDRVYNNFQNKGADGADGFFGADKSSSDYPIKIIWKWRFVRVLLVGGILWMMLILAVLLFHTWTCQSSLVFLSDVTETLLVEVDLIYHLACPAFPNVYKHNPVKTIKTHVIGTLNMLGLAKRVVARILLTSTSEVYGDPLVHPQDESYWGNVNPIGVRGCYDEGKQVAKTLMFEYHRQHGIEIRIAIIFNTYGPRMNIDDGRIVSNFIAQAIRTSQGDV